MAYNIELLRADITDEIDKIDLVIEDFKKIRSKIDLTANEVSYYDRGAIGYLSAVGCQKSVRVSPCVSVAKNKINYRWPLA